jgi:hypothetical protein
LALFIRIFLVTPSFFNISRFLFPIFLSIYLKKNFFKFNVMGMSWLAFFAWLERGKTIRNQTQNREEEKPTRRYVLRILFTALFLSVSFRMKNRNNVYVYIFFLHL